MTPEGAARPPGRVAREPVGEDEDVGDDASAGDEQRTWLELLAADRPAVELDRTRRQLLDAGSADDRSAVAAEAELALRIRGRLDERRQRADELTVLNDLARRLTSLLSPQELLEEVARQARRLLAVDVAYLMLLHDLDSLRIEVVDGSMGSVLRGIVLSRGSGLGGEILRTGQPAWSASYLDDERFTHLGPVDAAASSERLQGILGVPLLVGTETIGVLFAAERRRRDFADREVELLAALAAHAAVALRNAELFERQRRTEAELNQVVAALHEADVRRQRAVDLRERLTTVVIRGGGHADLVHQLMPAFDGVIGICDTDGALVAGRLPADFAAGPVFAEARSGGPASVQLDGGTQLTAAPVFLPGGFAGCLVLTSTRWDEARAEEVRQLLTIGADTVALVVANERSVTEAELRLRSELVHALLSGNVDDSTVRRRARAVGIDLDGVAVVAVCDPSGADPRAASRVVTQLAGTFRGWSAEHANRLVLLLPRTTAPAVTAWVRRLSGDGGIPGVFAVADCGGGVQEVRQGYEAARQSVAVVLALGRTSDYVDTAELGPYRALFSQTGRDQLGRFIDHTIGPLLVHDADQGRDLVRTLRFYLDEAQHHARTAAALHIHANTLYQRLERITELIGAGWRDPARAFDLQLALRLQGLRTVVEAADEDQLA